MRLPQTTSLFQLNLEALLLLLPRRWRFVHLLDFHKIAVIYMHLRCNFNCFDQLTKNWMINPCKCVFVDECQRCSQLSFGRRIGAWPTSLRDGRGGAFILPFFPNLFLLMRIGHNIIQIHNGVWRDWQYYVEHFLTFNPNDGVFYVNPTEHCNGYE